MALVASVNYNTKRIYLSADTVNLPALDTLEVYKEVRRLRRLNFEHRKPIISAGGNIPKVTGQSYTPAYVILAAGCYIVPYDAPHSLKVVRDTFTEDRRAGRDCFDRTSVISNVDLDIDFPEIEIRKVTTGGSSFDISDIWNYPARTLTSIDVSAIANSVASALASQFSAIPTPSQIANAVRLALIDEMLRIDAPISSRISSGGVVNANVKYVNDTPISGTGQPGNEWGPS